MKYLHEFMNEGGLENTTLRVKGLVTTGETPLLFKDTVIDDLTVPITDMVGTGYASPPLKLFMNKKTESNPGSSVGFIDGNTSSLNLTDMNFDNPYQIGFWIRPNYNKTRQFIIDSDNLTIFVDNVRKKLKIYIKHTSVTSGEVVLLGELAIDSGNSLFISFSQDANGSYIEYWLNSAKGILEGAVGSGFTETLTIGSKQNGTRPFLGELDELRFWNRASAGDFGSKWHNGGKGRPSRTWEVTDLVHSYNMDDTSGDLLDGTGSINIVNFNGTYEELFIIGIDSYFSIGVFSKAFEHGELQVLGFNKQMSHSKKEGSNLIPHFHGAVKQTLVPGDTVVLGFEYTWADIANIPGNQTHSVFGETVVVEVAINLYDSIGTLDPNSHLMSGFLGDIDMSNEKGVSAMLISNLYRRGDDERDTFTGDLFILEFDYHFEKDGAGSKTEAEK